MTALLYNTNLREISELEKRSLVIFDVGCNIEQSVLVDFTQQCLDYCQNSRILGIEPIHWQAYEKKYDSDPRISLLKYALSNSSDSRIFFDAKVAGCPGLSSFVQRPVFADWGDGVEQKLVTCTTVDEICKKGNIEIIDYLKIDTEGAELDILKGSIGKLQEHKIHYIQFEYGGCATEAGYGFQDIEFLLETYGYKVIHRYGDDFLAVSPKILIGEV